jgi:hypothetical protein
MLRMKSLRSRLFLVIATISAVSALGCGSDLPLGTVQGKVTKAGQPQANLWVKFSPVEGGRPSHARTDAEGNFSIQYKDQDGALVGRHRVVVGSGGEVDERGNPISRAVELLSTEVEVENGANEFNFEITSS